MLLGSVTDLTPSHRGLHVLVGSHGGEATGRHALRYGVAALICHDAGIGLDEAGIRGLSVLEAAGAAAAAIAHNTARIGDPEDMLARGLVSRANSCARAVGVEPGMAAGAAYSAIQHAVAAPGAVGQESNEAPSFGRFLLEVPSRSNPPFRLPVVIVDSASSLGPGDDGCVVITGSHGGLPGNSETRVIKANALMAVFNDAGGGIDDAGVRRLPVLETQGIGGVCVHAWSAHIGDGHSTYESGIVSFVNQRARALGAEIGMSIKEVVQGLADQRARSMIV